LTGESSIPPTGLPARGPKNRELVQPVANADARAALQNGAKTPIFGAWTFNLCGNAVMFNQSGACVKKQLSCNVRDFWAFEARDSRARSLVLA
jgi:hypothetical protein